MKTQYPLVLNALHEMQGSLLYAARKDILASAEQIITHLERLLNEVIEDRNNQRARAEAAEAALKEAQEQPAVAVPVVPFSDDDMAEIHQLAYELGGTDGGEYSLDGEQLEQVIVKAASMFYKPVVAVPAGELPAPAEYFVFTGADWHRATAEYYHGHVGEKLALYAAEQMCALLQSSPQAEQFRSSGEDSGV